MPTDILFRSHSLPSSISADSIRWNISYSDLALAVGCENSSRAVGSVMAENPWALLVPCHRVIRRNGAIGNYSGCRGPETKAWLLEYERGSWETIYK